jgi:uncharacterized protein (DUF1499 family)
VNARAAAVLAMIALAACGGLEPGSVEPAAIADPTTAARPSSPNSALVCPERACAAAADWTAPGYPAVAPEALFEAWREVLESAPRTTVVAIDPARLLIMAQQRSAVFRFVDTVTVRVLPVAGGGASFAALSRSEIGYADLGANSRRLRAWQAELERPAATPPAGGFTPPAP